MRPAQLLTILDREFISTSEGHHTPVMLWGPPGVGKSDMIRQTGERHRAPVIDIRLSQMEPSDLRGIPFRSGDFVEWAAPAILPDTARHGLTDPRRGAGNERLPAIQSERGRSGNVHGAVSPVLSRRRPASRAAARSASAAGRGVRAPRRA